MANDRDIVARRSAKRASVTGFLLDVRDDGTFWHGAERQDVSYRQSGILSSVDELTSVHALICDECLDPVLELVRISERHLDEWCAAARIVDDVLHHASNVTMLLGEIELSELSRGFVESGVGSYSNCQWVSHISIGEGFRTEN